MVQAKVRRLPVVNAGGKLEGIIAMDDVVAPIVLKDSGLKNSGRANQATSQDGVSTAVRGTDSPASRQGRRLST
jgi:hypothetical protein